MHSSSSSPEGRNVPRSAIPRSVRKAEQKAERERIRDLAKEMIPAMEATGEIAKLPVKLDDRVWNPLPPNEGIQFCVSCGKHGKFRLRDHLRIVHRLNKESDLYKVFEQIGKGILEKLKGASISLQGIPAPTTNEAMAIYDAFLKKIEDAGVPITGPRAFLPARGEAGEREAEGIVGMEEDLERVVPSNELPSTSDERRPPHERGTSEDATVTIPRSRLYISRNDEAYRGGESVHEHFKRSPDESLMFAWQDDERYPFYYSQTYNVEGRRNDGWMKDADEQLKLWRKVRGSEHPVTNAFRQQLHRTTMIPSTSTAEEIVEEPRGGLVQYAPYVERFMLASMRSRRRCGQTISLDDALFSFEITSPFFERLKRTGVPVDTRIAFAKALAMFYEFLGTFMNAECGMERRTTVQCAKETMRRVCEALHKEQADLRTYLPLMSGEIDEGTPYGIVRAILSHDKVNTAIRCIMNQFTSGAGLLRIQYNFVMSALMAYIVHSNAARNEVVYKVRYGNVFPTATQHGRRTCGLKEQLGQEEDGQERSYWVGAYPNPKSTNRVQNPSSYTGGLFVLDETSHRWMEDYARIRKYVAEARNVPRADGALTHFFLQWNGKPLKKSSIWQAIRRFFVYISCGTLIISCRTTRHMTAEAMYSEYWTRALNSLGGGVNEISRLQGHQTATQALYNRCYVQSSVYAYIKLKRYADDDASKHSSRLQEVERMINVIDLKIANEFLEAERRVWQLEQGNRPEADHGVSDGEAIDQDLYPGVGSSDEEMEAEQANSVHPGDEEQRVIEAVVAELEAEEQRLAEAGDGVQGALRELVEGGEEVRREREGAGGEGHPEDQRLAEAGDGVQGVIEAVVAELEAEEQRLAEAGGEVQGVHQGDLMEGALRELVEGGEEVRRERGAGGEGQPEDQRLAEAGDGVQGVIEAVVAELEAEEQRLAEAGDGVQGVHQGDLVEEVQREQGGEEGAGGEERHPEDQRLAEAGDGVQGVIEAVVAELEAEEQRLAEAGGEVQGVHQGDLMEGALRELVEGGEEVRRERGAGGEGQPEDQRLAEAGDGVQGVIEAVVAELEAEEQRLAEAGDGVQGVHQGDLVEEVQREQGGEEGAGGEERHPEDQRLAEAGDGVQGVHQGDLVDEVQREQGDEEGAGGEEGHPEGHQRGIVDQFVSTPALPHNVLRYMQEFNGMADLKGVTTLRNSYDLERFNRLRTAQPIQMFPWLEIREIPAIQGKGVFAKRIILKGDIVSDYRGVLIPRKVVTDIMESETISQEEKLLINDYVVDVEACSEYRGIEPYTKPMAYLAHRVIYKGSVTIGRLFNHSRDHANMELRQSCNMTLTPKGPQPLIISYLVARRKIKIGEQLLWNYGKLYRDLPAQCLCTNCNKNLVTNAVLNVEMNPLLLQSIQGVAGDDDSHSQRIWTLDDGAPPIITSCNVLRSLNNRAMIVGLVADGTQSSFEDPLAAYRESRQLVFGVEDGYPGAMEELRADAPPSSFAVLLRLARQDAYVNGNPVVIVITSQTSGRRRERAEAVVVLLGSLIGPLVAKRYGNCVVHDYKRNSFIAPTEKTEGDGGLRTLLEDYGPVPLLHFPVNVEEMWVDIEASRDMQLILRTMRENSC